MSQSRESTQASSEAEVKIEPSPEFRETALVASLQDYERLYRESLDQPETFWKRELGELVFRTPWTRLLDWQRVDEPPRPSGRPP